MQKLRSKALSFSHQVKLFFSDFGDAQRCGWILAKLFNGISIDVCFANSDAEERKATAVAIGSTSTIQKGYIRFVEMLEKGTQWRSFRFERLIF